MPRIIPFYHTAVFALTGTKGQRHVASFRLSTDAPSTVEAITYFCDVFSGGFPFRSDISQKFSESAVDTAGGTEVLASGDKLLQLMELGSKECTAAIAKMDEASKAVEEAKLKISQAVTAINQNDLGTARLRVGDPLQERPRGSEGDDAIGRVVAALRATDAAEENTTQAADQFYAALVISQDRNNPQLDDQIEAAIRDLGISTTIATAPLPSPELDPTGVKAARLKRLQAVNSTSAQERLKLAEECLFAGGFEGPREAASLWGFAIWHSEGDIAVARFGGSISDPATSLGTVNDGAIRSLTDAFNELSTTDPSGNPRQPNPGLAIVRLNEAIADIDGCFGVRLSEAREKVASVSNRFDFGCTNQRDPLLDSIGGLFAFESVRFFYSLFDENTGRELQNEKIHCMAGLGSPSTTRPRRLVRPLVMPRGTVVRVEVEEVFSLLTLGRIRTDLNLPSSTAKSAVAAAVGQTSSTSPATSSASAEDPSGFLKVNLHFTLHGYRTFPS